MAKRNGDVVAVIPARVNSTRLWAKNYEFLQGVALWDWALRACEMLEVGHVIFTTDEIRPKLLPDAHGKNAPIVSWLGRPEAHTGDSYKLWLDAIVATGSDLSGVPITILVEPTSPFRDLNVMEAVIKHTRLSGEGACSVRKTKYRAAKAFYGLSLKPLVYYGKAITTETQKLPTEYLRDGVIYSLTVKELLEMEKGIEMRLFVNTSPQPFISIDTQEDLDHARIFAEHYPIIHGFEAR